MTKYPRLLSETALSNSVFTIIICLHVIPPPPDLLVSNLIHIQSEIQISGTGQQKSKKNADVTYQCAIVLVDSDHHGDGYVTVIGGSWLCNSHWWLIKVPLLGAFGFFAPEFWEMAGTYKLSFCSKRNAASVVLTMLGGRHTQTLLDGKMNFELYALMGGGDTKTF